MAMSMIQQELSKKRRIQPTILTSTPSFAKSFDKAHDSEALKAGLEKQNLKKAEPQPGTIEYLIAEFDRTDAAKDARRDRIYRRYDQPHKFIVRDIKRQERRAAKRRAKIVAKKGVKKAAAMARRKSNPVKMIRRVKNPIRRKLKMSDFVLSKKRGSRACAQKRKVKVRVSSHTRSTLKCV
jgi:hypothetical protein